jgi:phenylpropionate dioxygenase-like ring-hydroxylating dioxygenase large terminal subunit
MANPDVVRRLAPVGSARAIRPGTVTRAWIGNATSSSSRPVGDAQAVTARGALGADLTNATAVEKGLQCAFHRWCWGADGSCAAGGGVAVGARITTYAVRERWGLVWVWAGRSPAYDLPFPEPPNRAHVLRLPAQRLACHGHVVLGNGLDLTHVVPVHRFRFEDDPVIELEPPHRLSVGIHARFEATLLRRVLGLAARAARWRFTTIGPSLAWVNVTAPTPFELVWAARPLPDGGCATQTIFFLPRWSSLARALPMMVATTWADRRVLQGDFRPGSWPGCGVARYAQLVEAMPEW